MPFKREEFYDYSRPDIKITLIILNIVYSINAASIKVFPLPLINAVFSNSGNNYAP